MRNVISLVLGGGRGTRLYPLTKYRSKPAVPLAGRYRLIDIPLSNCINSGLNRIYVLTQFMSVSLHRHIRQTYRFDNFGGGFVELLAAQQTDAGGTDWYEGTADAVRKNVRYVDQPEHDYVLILSGDQLYRMDYREMLRTHIDSGADATIAALAVTPEQAGGLGVMRADESGRVTGFLEKPKRAEDLQLVQMSPQWFAARGLGDPSRTCLASMGIYIFNRKFLVDLLNKTDYSDFGKEVFPASIRARRVQAHLFDGYWEDIGTIRAFYDANLSLCRPDPPFDLRLTNQPVFSRARFLPPSLIRGARVDDSLLVEGGLIGSDTLVKNSVVGVRNVIGDGVEIRDSILMGADYYDRADGESSIPLGIGAGSKIHGAIVDKNCRIGRNVEIVNHGAIVNSQEHPLCMVRDGIAVVVKEAEIPDGWRLADHLREQG